MNIAIGIIIALVLVNIRLIVLLVKANKAYYLKANMYKLMFTHVKNVITLYNELRDECYSNEGFFHCLKGMDKEVEYFKQTVNVMIDYYENK